MSTKNFIFQTTNKPLARLSFFVVFLVLCFPLFSWIPFREPYVIGPMILLNFFTPALLFIQGWSLLKNPRIVINSSPLFQLLFFSLAVGMALQISGPHPLQLQTLFTLLCYAGLLSQMSFHKEQIKRLLGTWSPVFLTFYLTIYHVRPRLEVFGHPQFLGIWGLLLSPILLTSLLQARNSKLKLFNLIPLLLLYGFLFRDGHSRILPILATMQFSLFVEFRWSRFKPWMHCLIPGAGLVLLFFLKKDSLLHSLDDRWWIFKLCLDHMSSIPFFGAGGMGSFERFFLEIQNGTLVAHPSLFAAGKTIPIEWAHNEWLQSLVEFGFPGLVLSLSLAGLIMKTYLEWYQKKDNRALYYFGLITMGLYSGVSFPFHMPCSGFLGGMLICLMALEKSPLSASQYFVFRFSLRAKWNLFLVETAGLWIAALFLLNIQSFLGHYYFTKGLNTSTGFLYLSDLENSVRWDPSSKLSQFALGKVYLDAGRFSEAENAFDRSAQIAPHYATLFGLALSQDLQGKTEQAKDLYEKIKRMAPDYTPASHNLNTLLQRLTLFYKTSPHHQLPTGGGDVMT